MIGDRYVTRKVFNSCMICARFRSEKNCQLMGNLSTQRVVQSRPFLKTFVDYYGPVCIKERKHRNRNRQKIDVSIFACSATEAVHLEVVSDMTTDAFFGCLRRFFAQRGKSKEIYSDNVRTFVGASYELDFMRF